MRRASFGLLLCLLVGSAQVHAQGYGPSGVMAGARLGGAPLKVTVVDEQQQPLQQPAMVRITGLENGKFLFQVTHDSFTIFQGLAVGQYLLEAGAPGCLGMHERFSISDASRDYSDKIALKRDPTGVDLSLTNEAQLPAKVRKDAEKGLRDLQLSNYTEARKHLEAANHDDPTSSYVNFLLGYLAVQQKDIDRALEILTTATKLDPKNVQAQNLLGQVCYARGDYANAAAAEEIVLAASPNSTLPRRLLADSCLKLKQYEKARDNAQWLVSHGGEDAAPARLILGQALAGLHQNAEAIRVLQAYLDGQPAGPVADQVRKLIAQLQH